jgi:beta-lactamase regulating signal transducer with metallopeptidase domain
MIDVLNTWGASWAAYFGPAVLQNTLFLALILLALHILRNTRAGLRYALCFIGMVKILLPPFLATGQFETSGGAVPMGYVVDLSARIPSPPIGQAMEYETPLGLGLSGLLFSIWAGGVVIVLVHAAISVADLRRRLKRAVPAGGLPYAYPKGGKVEILKTDAVPAPLTFGLLRPKLYVPEDWDTWGRRCRSLVLAHEVAHIKRGDRYVQVLQVVMRSLYFFHPLVWLLDGRMSSYREMACDDAATEKGAGRTAEYSRHLVDIAERVVGGRVSWRSASAFLKHRNGLLNRVRYQLEVKKMKAISGRTKVLVLAGFMLLALPLSWYCGRAETGQAQAPSEGAAFEMPKSMQKVTVALKQDRSVSVDGEVVAVESLAETLEASFPSDRDRVLVQLDCEDGVAMGRVSQVHKIMVDSGFMKVLYVGAPAEGLPLVLPSVEHQEKLARLAGEHVAVIKIGLPGRPVLDGEPIKVTEVRQAIAERLAKDPYLVVSLVWAPTAKYEDFITVLGLVKAAGAKRIAVKIGA